MEWRGLLLPHLLHIHQPLVLPHPHIQIQHAHILLYCKAQCLVDFLEEGFHKGPDNRQKLRVAAHLVSHTADLEG